MNQTNKGSKTKGKEKAKNAMTTIVKKKRRHKPKDFPKRPLSAYNIFFKETREAILAENEGKREIAFQNMAKEIAARWKNLNPEDKQRVNSLAEKDKKRYRQQVKTYEEEMVKRSIKEREEAENLRRIQAAVKSKEQSFYSAIALSKGPSTANSIDTMEQICPDDYVQLCLLDEATITAWRNLSRLNKHNHERILDKLRKRQVYLERKISSRIDHFNAMHELGNLKEMLSFLSE